MLALVLPHNCKGLRNDVLINQPTYYNYYRYKNAVSELADLFAMERNNPLQNAVWLLEYVSKTKGAEHMKIASTEYSWVRYYCIDLFTLCLVVCYILRCLLVVGWRACLKFSKKKRKVD